ncbi:hypothetical protein [Terrisporobacter sp.]|uniref:hypothetical protein n=1 Tax=Terrisporobacter sp. TaxID=1965305 RepID=UPI002F4112FE
MLLLYLLATIPSGKYAGKWHNVINIGSRPIKLYAIYAPPEHPKNTVHPTKADSEAAEESDF